MNKKITLGCIVSIVLLFFQSCASVSISNKKSMDGQTPFARTIEEYTLDNGITVYVKENHSNRLVSLALVEKGGVRNFLPEQSGFEMSLIRMIKSGSEKYSYDDIQDIKYKTHASFYGAAMNEGSYLEIDCLDYYFDQMLDVFCDGILNPVFAEDEFNTMMKEHSQRLQRMQSDPASFAYYTGIDLVYSDHPYKTHPWPTEKSIQNITIEGLKKLHEDFLDAGKISFVLVGNIDGAKAVRKLNAMFGSVPRLTQAKDFLEPVEKIKISGENVVLSSSASEGTGFILGFFASPSITDEDFMSAHIASDMFGDMLYQVVREKYGACYTPSCGTIWSNAAFGLINLYRVSNLEKAVSYADEAQSLMAQGKLISGKDENDQFVFTTIEDRLESYKNIFINETYTEQKTVSGLCSKMVNSLLLFGNPYSSDEFAVKVREVTAESVEKAFQKYIVNGKRQYVAVTAPEQESKVKF